MKKFLACLTSVVLLASLLLVGIVPMSAANGKAENFFFDLSSEAAYNAAIDAADGISVKANNANATDIVYDAAEGAMKVSIKNNTLNGGGQLVFNASAESAAEDDATYPVFALLVKRVSNKAELGLTYYARSYGSGWHGIWPAIHEGQTLRAYQAADEWELLTYEVSDPPYGNSAYQDNPGVNSNWKGFMITAVENDETFANDEAALYVKWAGAFASKDDAIAYQETMNQPVEEESDKANKFFFNLSNEAGYAAAVDAADGISVKANNANATDIVYDAAEGAMKVSIKNNTLNGGGQLTFNASAESGAEDDMTYPVFAMMVKRVSNKAELGLTYYARSYGSGWHGIWPAIHEEQTLKAYQAADEWELVTYELSDSPYDLTAYQDNPGANSNWKGILFSAVDNDEAFANDEAALYIQWAGAFKSKADAEAFAANPSFDPIVTTTTTTTTTESVTTTTTVPGGNEDDDDDDETGLPKPGAGGSAFFFDFSTNSNVEKYKADYVEQADIGAGKYGLGNGNESEAQFIYDATEGAMKVVAGKVEPEEQQYYDNAKGVYPRRNAAVIDITTGAGTVNDLMEDYPIIALKVKLTKKDTINHGASISRRYGSGWLGVYLDTENPYEDNQNTEEWQLLTFTKHQYYEFASLVDGDLSWKGVRVKLTRDFNADSVEIGGEDVTAATFEEGETVAYVQWAGAFASKTAAQIYFDETSKDQTGSEEDEQAEHLFADFRDEAGYNTAVDGAILDGYKVGEYVSFEHDAENGAAKITFKVAGAREGGGRYDTTLYVRPTNKVSAKDNKFVVAKVKVSNTGTITYADYVKSGNVTVSYGGNHYYTDEDPLMIPAGDGWVYTAFSTDTKVDAANLPDGAVWDEVRIIGNGDTYNAGDTYSIAWIGAFSSIEEAIRIMAPSEGGDVEGGLEAPTDVFWDLTTESGVKYNVEASGDTVISYDEELKAMKVVAEDTNKDGVCGSTPGKVTFGLTMPLEPGLTIADYPYVALRVKLSKALQDGSGLYARSSGSLDSYKGGMLQNADQLLTTVNYTNMTNWQTIIVNTQDDPFISMFLTGDWKTVSFNAFSASSIQPGDTMWIAWAGAFASEQDVLDFVAANAANELGNTAAGETVIPDPGADDDEDGDEDKDQDQDQDQDKDEDENDKPADTGVASTAPFVAVVMAIAFTAMAVLVFKKKNAFEK